jgi:sigma-E factor negative regulatory protein RseB
MKQQLKKLSLYTVTLVWVLAWVLSFIMYPVAIAGTESDTAKQWLQRMLENAQTLNYRGTFVYVQGQNLDVMSIVHSGSGEKQRQRLVALNGAAREITVIGEEAICLLPDQQIAFNTSKYKHTPLPIKLPQELDSLEQSYRFVESGDDRVADRTTRIISIEPQDDLRFGYRLWLDRETGMILRSALLDDQGQVREQFAFTEFEVLDQVVGELFESQFISAHNVARTIDGNSFNEVVHQPKWQAERLPSGFKMILQQRRPNSAQDVAAEQVVFSDGLAAISVFLEEIQSDGPLLEGPTQQDALNAYGVVTAGYQIIAVGEAPLKTVEQIARAMQRTP